MSASHSDVLFAFPPAPGNAGAFRNHLGAAYLRAALAREGLKTSQYLNECPGTIDAVATDIVGRKCPIVGFTVYDSNARLCLALAQSIKAKKPETKVVFGGPTATFSAQALMERHEAIDLCVMGEAEETGERIVTTILEGRELDEAQKGIVFRREGQVVSTGWAPLTAMGKPGMPCDLDSTPSPYLTGLLRDGREGILTGRGCTHHCQYCCFAAVGRGCLRLHSIDRVVQELECIAEYQAREGNRHPVAIQDDAFTLAPRRAKELCRTIMDQEFNLVLSCITRADTLDDELVKLMWEAGFRSVAFGLESAVPSVLRATGKVRPPDWHDPDLSPERMYLDRVRQSVRLSKKQGLRVTVSIILGLPSELPEDAAETLRFVKELEPDVYIHNFLQVFAGTPLATTHDRHGISCALDASGLPETSSLAYDVESVRPGSNCDLRYDVEFAKLLAADALNGCSGISVPAGGVGTVVLEDYELSTETARWLQTILSIGGHVARIYREKARPEDSEKLRADRKKMREVPVNCYIQIFPRNGKSGTKRWEVGNRAAEVYRQHQPSILSFYTSEESAPLRDWSEGREVKASVCDICELARTPEEFKVVLNRIEALDTDKRLERMPAPPLIKYPGRWLRGKCPCLSLTRIEVSPNGQVRCCKQGRWIGQVGDSLKTMSERLTSLVKEAEERRACAKCPNEDCPRCPFPGVDDRTYCEFMAQKETMQNRLTQIWLYSRIPILVAREQFR